MATISEIKQFTASVKQLTAHARGGGPKSAEGKARSALNSVRHGLAGRGLLLPGEDANEYERRMDGVFVALAPGDEAQAELAALVGDDLHKIRRLARIENGITVARIEEFLATTEMAEKTERTKAALLALGAALEAWVREPVPTERNVEFSRRMDAMIDALDLVTSIKTVPAELTDNCDSLLVPLAGRPGEVVVPMDTYRALTDAAGLVMSQLLDQGQKLDAAEDELRRALGTIALPDEAELRKLAKYRRMLEDGLLRRLQALEQLRKLSSGKTSEESAERSKEFRVRLRLVK